MFRWLDNGMATLSGSALGDLITDNRIDTHDIRHTHVLVMRTEEPAVHLSLHLPQCLRRPEWVALQFGPYEGVAVPLR